MGKHTRQRHGKLLTSPRKPLQSVMLATKNTRSSSSLNWKRLLAGPLADGLTECMPARYQHDFLNDFY